MQSWTPAIDAECIVEIADRELRVSASYREKSSYHYQDAAVWTNCLIPPLDAGTWTLVYDGIEASFVVGQDQPQPLACVGEVW